MQVRVLLAAACSLSLATALTIHVPEEQPSVQAGLNAAGSGDTVPVADSTYNENIVWPSTDEILLLSESGPELTVISGGGNGRVVSFSGSYTRATCIQGFSITGGKTNSGAGIMVGGGSPSIVGNIIENNTCRGGRDYGAGIYVGSNCAPLIKDNVIRNNACQDTSTWNHGGGIYVGGGAAPEICFNHITGNVCSQGYWNYGAGVYVGLQGRGAIYQNLITDNVCTQGDRGHGAGVYTELQASPVVFCNLIVGNTCSSQSWNYGAGIACKGPGVIIGNTIADNACVGGNWRCGGGIFMDSQALIKNNIVVANAAASGGGIYSNRGTVTRLSYNDVWSNTGGDYYGCTAGPGDISQDPLFTSGARGEYYLSQTVAGQPQTSPCVDAGDTLLATSPLNLDSLLRNWTTRTDSVPDHAAIDMGYHCSREEHPVATPSPDRESLAPGIRPVPNPFSSQIRFAVHVPDPVSLTVYDVSGKAVWATALRRGGGAVTWRPGRIAAGTYFYRLVFRDCLAQNRPARVAFGRLVKAR